MLFFSHFYMNFHSTSYSFAVMWSSSSSTFESWVLLAKRRLYKPASLACLHFWRRARSKLHWWVLYSELVELHWWVLYSALVERTDCLLLSRSAELKLKTQTELRCVLSVSCLLGGWRWLFVTSGGHGELLLAVVDLMLVASFQLASDLQVWGHTWNGTRCSAWTQS